MIEPIKIEVTGVTDKEAFCKLLSQKFDIPVVYEKKGKAMTTNLEWLYENDRENLINMIEGDCYSCKFNDNYCSCGECRCDRKWLEAEYVEPDSWEKIERDARQGMDYYYFELLDMSRNHLESAEEAHRYIVEDIINRCKALAGVE